MNVHFAKVMSFELPTRLLLKHMHFVFPGFEHVNPLCPNFSNKSNKNYIILYSSIAYDL